MAVLWLADIGADDLETVGGKAASLGELAAAELPVPPAFVVTAETYRKFIEEAGIAEELFETLDVDVEDSGALASATERAQSLIRETPTTTSGTSRSRFARPRPPRTSRMRRSPGSRRRF